jgi:5-formyltetrahydrofolate cyclo-ligase
VDYRKQRMEFVRWDEGTPLRPNRFGIPEPADVRGGRIAPIALDIVVLPLLAVDRQGWRLGSGAGYYDRRLRHLRMPRQWRRPRLIGLAYDFQRLGRIEHESWDVPLDAVLTERSFHSIIHSSRGES